VNHSDITTWNVNKKIEKILPEFLKTNRHTKKIILGGTEMPSGFYQTQISCVALQSMGNVWVKLEKLIIE